MRNIPSVRIDMKERFRGDFTLVLPLVCLFDSFFSYINCEIDLKIRSIESIWVGDTWKSVVC